MRLRKAMQRFRISIFLASEAFSSGVTDQAAIPLVKLHEGTLLSDDARIAAATAWVNHVGMYRHDRLVLMHSPQQVVNASIDVGHVAMQLRRSCLFGDGHGFWLDNRVEAWLISVIEER